MIRLVRHKEIDTEKWDRAIHRSMNSRPYAMSWYLDATCREWDALIEDDYQVVMPLPKRTKWGFQYVFVPHWVQQLGVFAPDPERAENAQRFLDRIPEEFSYMELWLNSGNKLNSANWEQYDSSNYELDLESAYEEIRKGFSKNCKRNVRRSADQGLSLLKNSSPEALIHLFRQNKGKKVGGLEDMDFERLKHLMHAGIHRGIAQCWGVFDDSNTQVAGAYFLFHFDRAVFLFSGLSEEGRERAAMFFLIDQFIREHAASGIILDFEGSNDSDLARFYSSFGAEDRKYLRLRKNRLPFYISWIKSRKPWKP
jgi:hypothetical protein